MPKFHHLSFLCIALCCGCAMAQLNPSSKPDDVLNALQTSGKNVKSFSANLELDEYNNGSGAETKRVGKVWFQFNPAGDPVMHIALTYKQIGSKKIADKIDYLLDNGWLLDRTETNKTESRIQLVPQGQKVNLFQLGKSPFPMPIGQDPAEIKKQFEATTAAQAKEDPANTIHLALKPKPGSDMAKQFSTVDIWTDLTTNMPVRIATQDSKQDHTNTADLKDLKLNPVIAPADITLPPLPQDWRSDVKPLPTPEQPVQPAQPARNKIPHRTARFSGQFFVQSSIHKM